MMQNLVEASVIVPTYNGNNKILNILRSLEKQVCQDFETIVVVDGSTDDTLMKLNQTQFALKSLKVIVQSNKGRAGARNAGAKAATGDLLIFFDDDMRPIPHCIREHLKHHQYFENSICVGPQINDWMNASTELQKYKCFVSRKWGSKLNHLEEGKPLLKEDIYITAGNFSLGKELFWKIGGLDEQLKDLEDFDFAIKSYMNNIPIFFNKSAFGWHDEDYTLASYISRRKGYLQAKEQLKDIKPETIPFIKRLEPSNFRMKKWFFWLFSFDFWIMLVDKHNIFQWLPKKVRFKLYDFIITSNVIYFP